MLGAEARVALWARKAARKLEMNGRLPDMAAGNESEMVVLLECRSGSCGWLYARLMMAGCKCSAFNHVRIVKHVSLVAGRTSAPHTGKAGT